MDQGITSAISQKLFHLAGTMANQLLALFGIISNQTAPDNASVSVTDEYEIAAPKTALKPGHARGQEGCAFFKSATGAGIDRKCALGLKAATNPALAG